MIRSKHWKHKAKGITSKELRSNRWIDFSSASTDRKLCHSHFALPPSTTVMALPNVVSTAGQAATAPGLLRDQKFRLRVLASEKQTYLPYLPYLPYVNTYTYISLHIYTYISIYTTSMYISYMYSICTCISYELRVIVSFTSMLAMQWQSSGLQWQSMQSQLWNKMDRKNHGWHDNDDA